MPIHLGKDSKGPFVQWGHQKKYHYKANDKQSLANAKSRAKKQMKAIFSSGYVGQDIQNNINLIEQIKNKLLQIFKKCTWQQFIDSQKFGDCHKIACYVAQLFPNIQIIEVMENFCQSAVQQLHNLNDNFETYSSHYFNKINNVYYDFGKGTNTISGIYLIGTEEQKYSVQLEENQLNCFYKFYVRAIFPKYQLNKKWLYKSNNNLFMQNFNNKNDTICHSCGQEFNWETQVDQYQDETGQLIFKCPWCRSEDLRQLQVNNNIPQYLYHATYRPLLRKIKQLGLGNTKRTYWEDSKPGVVYLADDPDVAESYAECNQNLKNEDWLDQIIIFRIDTSKLDKSKLFIDENVKLDEGQINATWQYHGIIPFENLQLINNMSFKNQSNMIYQSKFDKLFEEIISYLDMNITQQAITVKKYIKLENSNLLPICLQDGTICTIIYNSYPIKDLIKQNFDATYLPHLKAWRVQQKIDNVYSKLIQLMKQHNLIETNKNNYKFLPNTYLQNYQIKFNNIIQKFGTYGKYLVLQGINSDGVNFILNNSVLTKKLFQYLYYIQQTNKNVLQNIKINFNGNIVSNNFSGSILINKVVVNNQNYILNLINTLTSNLPKKKFLIVIKQTGKYSNSVGSKLISDTIFANSKNQAIRIIDQKYPYGFIQSIKEIN